MNDVKEMFDETVDEFFNTVEGHSIISVTSVKNGYILEIDDGSLFTIRGTYDCCAYSIINKMSLHNKAFSNVITSVERMEKKDGSERWFFLADMNEVTQRKPKLLTVDVDASEGTGYYTFGFEIEVKRV